MAIEEGKFEIDDIIICKDTKISEFKKRDRYKIFPNDDDPDGIVSCRKEVSFLDITCNWMLYFYHERLSSVELTPQIEGGYLYDWPTPEEEKKKYELCRLGLEKKYGPPDVEDELSFTYKFPGGTISSYLERDSRNPYIGGYIKIEFGE